MFLAWILKCEELGLIPRYYNLNECNIGSLLRNRFMLSELKTVDNNIEEGSWGCFITSPFLIFWSRKV
jgi:hypothetical protein